jgi:D-glycero-D-manno-heptose 1,7-bisphosphate phosphatase
MAVSGRPAAFLDRDGTIIHDANYIRDPRDVALLPGAAAAIRRLNEADLPVIVMTNQSGIARGLLDFDDYTAVRERIESALGDEGASITATYMCPHHPDVNGPCECRKPGLLMYRQAIHAHGIDPARSLFVGDRWRDVEPAAALGGMGILLDVASTPPEDLDRARLESVTTAASLADAVDRFLGTLPASSRRP